MNFKKVLATGAVVFGTLAASPAVFAHASFTIGGSSAAPVWLNGVPAIGTEFPNNTNGQNIPSTAFVGVHGATASNNRIIETGYYSTAASDAQLGGSFNGVATSYKNTLLGQLANYNAGHSSSPYGNGVYTAGTNPLTNTTYTQAVAVTQGSAANPIYNGSSFNQGDLYLNPYAGSGSTTATPDGEENIILSTGAQYLNVSIASDQYAVTGTNNGGQAELAYSIYQGIATGPGLQGLVLLGSGTASAPGAEIDFSIALQGKWVGSDASSGGQFTLVVQDASQSSDSSLSNYIAASNFDPYVKVGFWETGAGSANTNAGLSTNSSLIYQEQGNPAPVPVPGAVWLFGSAIAGFIGFGRCKQAA